MQIFYAGAAAKTALSVVSATFADLLQAASATSRKSTAETASTQPILAGRQQVAPNGPGLLRGHRPGSGDSVDVAGLRKQTDVLIQDFHERLKQLLAESGIDLSSGLHLQLDAAGQIRVANLHLDGQSIESVMRAHPELADIFRAIAANSQLLRALRQTANSQSQSVQSGTALTASSHQPTSDNSEPTFDLFLDTDQHEVSFLPPRRRTV